jgi:hypothetical protein
LTDQADTFTAIERTIVEWLQASGFRVAHQEAEWTLEEVEQGISITALACAIHQAIQEPVRDGQIYAAVSQRGMEDQERAHMKMIMDECAAIVVLAENNVPIDIQELLVRGDPMEGIPPHVLGKAVATIARD